MAVMGDDRPYPGDPRMRTADNLDVPGREHLIRPYLPSPRSQRPSTTTTGTGTGTGTSTTATATTTTTTARSRSRRRQKPRARPKPVRAFLKSQLHYLIYVLIHIFLAIYVHLRQSYQAVLDRIFAILYHHHRTPELIRKDVRGLSQLPEHLSAVLTLNREDDALETLMDEVAELAAWSSCAGIPMLSVYEKTGILKSYIPALHKIIISKFASYYGHRSRQPILNLFAPHHSLYTPPSSPSASSTATADRGSLTLLLLSASDGRETLVDLTKTLTEMAQHGKLSPQDISTKLIDAEISETMSTPTPASPSPSPSPAQSPGLQSHSANRATAPRNGRSPTAQSPPRRHPSAANGRHDTNAAERTDADADADTDAAAAPSPLIKPEPDLLLVFGPIVKLDGYPPWQMRLTEIACTGDKSSTLTGGSEAVEYQRFLKGLWRFARAEMRFGR